MFLEALELRVKFAKENRINVKNTLSDCVYMCVKKIKTFYFLYVGAGSRRKDRGIKETKSKALYKRRKTTNSPR